MSNTSKRSLDKAARYRAARPKVLPFARFEGTSAWKKYRSRARAYATFRTAARALAQAAPAQSSQPAGH